MRDDRFAELVDQFMRRVERSGGALCDVCDPRTAQQTFLFVAGCYQIDAIELLSGEKGEKGDKGDPGEPGGSLRTHP